MIDATALALVGTAGAAANVAGLGLQLADMGITEKHNAKPNTDDDILNICVQFTTAAQQDLEQFYDCVAHSPAGLEKYENLSQALTLKIARLSALMTPKSNAPKPALHKMVNACKRALSPRCFDERYREVKALHADLQQYSHDIIKVQTATARNENMQAKKRTAGKDLKDLNAVVTEAEKSGELAKLTDRERTAFFEEKAQEYIPNPKVREN
ncbi:hypothetical protein Moror_13046 [Moniliophthora roreri MCA 2997]|uniref:Uncharacterized protein n=1 Tax=Moniliophthora roreri (strain MCA 2997) TaxID=1381753 RepID=V2X3Z9_MONRO|nr:hypothetical protein Moror_13046 [Moniliophthora roreri MCA 2997]KAI3604771.1 hypothetical protein WG66_008471 [Moniliophthora roreri]